MTGVESLAVRSSLGKGGKPIATHEGAGDEARATQVSKKSGDGADVYRGAVYGVMEAI